MKKTRRYFKDIYPAGPTYARAIRTGDFLFISGCTARGSNAQGRSPVDQLKVILDRITRMVAKEGGKPSDIVKFTTYVTNINNWWPITGNHKEIYDQYFNGEFPTNSIVEVTSLAEPGLDIEIEATAMLD